MSENQDWSKLCPDLLRTILESLRSVDFHRAKTVCSDWYSVWKTCMRQSLRPWQITYQGDPSTLFDPKEDTELLGLFSESYCLASSGSCLLLVDSGLEFCILNLLTRKRINLPSITLAYPALRIGWRQVFIDIEECKTLAVLWINERTGEYVVAWIFRQQYLFSLSHKKGYNSKWNLNGERVFDMAYNKSKLYLYTLDHHIKIYDLSGASPKWNNTYHLFHFVEQPWEYIWKRKIVIPKSGEVLIILSLKEVIHEEILLFYIFKMNLESRKWERVDSIGDDDEMLIFGHGVTIRAPVQDVGDGIKRGSICFVEDDVWPDSDRPSNCGIFDLATSKITWPKRSGVYIDQTQWFLPGSA